MFWIAFPGMTAFNLPGGAGLGVGVTAIDERDAVALVQAVVFDGGRLPECYSIEWLRSLDDLDQNHVRPNMGFHLRRRVWYPNIGDPQIVDW